MVMRSAAGHDKRGWCDTT